MPDPVHAASQAILGSLSTENYRKTMKLARARRTDRGLRSLEARATYDVRVPRWMMADLINALEGAER